VINSHTNVTKYEQMPFKVNEGVSQLYKKKGGFAIVDEHTMIPKKMPGRHVGQNLLKQICSDV
jgi:hypothetical protein